MKNKKIKKQAQPAQVAAVKTETSSSFYKTASFHYFIVALLAFLFYANTIGNEYALDDAISITANKFTQQGFKGISNIFTKDTFTGYAGEGAELSGGRWRPLALITFAAEHQFFGNSPHVSHFINALLYALLGVVLLRFLRKFIFHSKPVFGLIATLIFVIHPVHTEVVANIKSRDEILSFLFLTLVLHHSLRWLNEKKISILLLSLLYFFLALLSKENGLTFLAIIPLTFIFFGGTSVKEAFLKALPAFSVVVIYILLRFAFIGFHHKPATDVNIAPYLYATTSQWLATIVWVLGKYIVMLFYPYPLSSDYSFNQIPYKEFGDPLVLLSLAIHVLLIFIAIRGWKSRSVFSYAVLFYLGSIFIVSNIAVDTGGIFGERFLFQPSLGFALCITGIMQVAAVRMSVSSQRGSLIVLGAVLTGVCGYEVIQRNAQWKDNSSLYIHDVEVCPNSVRTNEAAGAALINLYSSETDTSVRNEKMRKAIEYELKALQISPKSVTPYMFLGAAYFNLGNADMAEKMWNETSRRNSAYQMEDYYQKLEKQFIVTGLNLAGTKNYSGAISYFYKALRYAPSDAEAWYNLGGAYYTIGRFDSAQIAWEKTILLKPDYKEAKDGLNAIPKTEKKK